MTRSPGGAADEPELRAEAEAADSSDEMAPWGPARAACEGHTNAPEDIKNAAEEREERETAKRDEFEEDRSAEAQEENPEGDAEEDPTDEEEEGGTDEEPDPEDSEEDGTDDEPINGSTARPSQPCLWQGSGDLHREESFPLPDESQAE
jgi:hypothetical protein